MVVSDNKVCNSVTSEHCIKDNYKINVKSLQANNLLRSLCEIARIDETIVKIRPKAVIEVILNGSDYLLLLINVYFVTYVVLLVLLVGLCSIQINPFGLYIR